MTGFDNLVRPTPSDPGRRRRLDRPTGPAAPRGTFFPNPVPGDAGVLSGPEEPSRRVENVSSGWGPAHEGTPRPAPGPAAVASPRLPASTSERGPLFRSATASESVFQLPWRAHRERSAGRPLSRPRCGVPHPDSWRF